MKKFILIIFIFFLGFNLVNAEEVDNTLSKEAKSAILIEASTGNILYEYNSHEKLAPASMTKIMSLLVIMESIENDMISLNDMVTVSDNASSMGGSQILLETGEEMSVDDLLKGVTIASGNDAVVALAEATYGTEENFVKQMNIRTHELGLNDTNFKNAHGLDEIDHYSSAYDMAMIARELIKHEKILEYSSIYETYLRENTDRKVWLVNTNKLVRFKPGVDGLKTGYTESAGYCLTSTMKKDGMRVVSVVMGEPSSQVRNSETSGLLDYAFSQYKIDKVLSSDSVVETKKIYKAKVKEVEIVPVGDVSILTSKTQVVTPTFDIKINDLKAPIKKGEVVGSITVKNDNEVIDTVNLTVKNDVKAANILELYYGYLKNMINGKVS